MLTALEIYVVASYVGVGIWALKVGSNNPVALWAWLLSPLSAPALIWIAIRDRDRMFRD